MQIPQGETPMPLVKAIEAATGYRPHLSTALRWCQRENRNGVRLESWMLGGRRVTSVEAVHRFNQANTDAVDGVNRLPVSTTRQAAKAHADAKRELAKEFAS